nr:putative fibroblast growth factor 1 [Salvelinus alpinus]
MDSEVICSRIIQLTRLYCMNGGHDLQILPDGTVGVWTMVLVVIQGTEAGCYLALSQNCKSYQSSIVTDPFYFLEKMEVNHYNTYQAQMYKERSWYVGLKKNGKHKLDSRTHIGQKAIFLPRRLEGTGE